MFSKGELHYSPVKFQCFCLRQTSTSAAVVARQEGVIATLREELQARDARLAELKAAQQRQQQQYEQRLNDAEERVKQARQSQQETERASEQAREEAQEARKRAEQTTAELQDCNLRAQQTERELREASAQAQQEMQTLREGRDQAEARMAAVIEQQQERESIKSVMPQQGSQTESQTTPAEVELEMQLEELRGELKKAREDAEHARVDVRAHQAKVERLTADVGEQGDLLAQLAESREEAGALKEEVVAVMHAWGQSEELRKDLRGKLDKSRAKEEEARVEVEELKEALKQVVADSAEAAQLAVADAKASQRQDEGVSAARQQELGELRQALEQMVSENAELAAALEKSQVSVILSKIRLFSMIVVAFTFRSWMCLLKKMTPPGCQQGRCCPSRRGCEGAGGDLGDPEDSAG